MFIKAKVADENILAISALGIKAYELNGMIMYLAVFEERLLFYLRSFDWFLGHLKFLEILFTTQHWLINCSLSIINLLILNLIIAYQYLIRFI
jgi:hypothetical protein